MSTVLPVFVCAHEGVNLADSLEPDDYEDEDELMRGAGMGLDEEAMRSYMLDHAMMLDSADAHANGTVQYSRPTVHPTQALLFEHSHTEANTRSHERAST